MRTGEGKTVVLGVAACVLALLGMEVSVACYSEYLSLRDRDTMAPMFRALDVEGDSIEYCTLVKLCEGEINRPCNIRAAVQGMILGGGGGGGTVAAAARRGGACGAMARLRVLLVDEVDVFFSEDFYGRWRLRRYQ